MGKKLIAYLLSITLLLGLLPVSALAEEAQAVNKVVAAFCSNVTMDGRFTESAWVRSARMTDGDAEQTFGVLWSATDLYIAAIPQVEDTLSVTVRGKNLTVDLSTGNLSGDLKDVSSAVVDTVVEVKIPLEALNIIVTAYGQEEDLRITLGSLAWEGKVVFVSDDRSITPAMDSVVAVNPAGSPNLSHSASSGQFRMCYKYVEGITASGDQAITRAQLNIPVLGETEKNLVIEFDFCANAMPEYPRAFSSNRLYIVRGFNMMVKDVNGKGYVVGITNTENGLYMAIAGQKNMLKLDKSVGETVNIRLERTPTLQLRVYVDGVLKATCQDPSVDTAWGSATRIINCKLWADDAYAVTADKANDIDFTVSNIRVGSGPTDVLEGLNFGAIKGENLTADSVSKDLSLPEAWSNGQLSPLRLVWSSSHPDVISEDGKVSAPAQDTTVTITATLAADASVSRDITVKVPRMRLTAQLATEQMTIDGKMDESVWRSSRNFRIRSGDSAPTGKLYAAWSKGIAYFAVPYTNARTLELILGDKHLTLDLTNGAWLGESYGAAAKVVDGVAELSVDMAALGQPVTDYGDTAELAAVLTGNGGTANLESRPVGLVFACEPTTVMELGSFSKSGATVSNGVGHFATNDTTSNLLMYKTDIAPLNHDKELMFSQEIYVEKMPVGTGRITGDTAATGYYFWLSDLIRVSGSTTVGNMLFGNIYNSGTGLILQLRQPGAKNGVYNSQSVALNRKVGDRFHLSILWTTDDAAVVYVDGEFLARIENVTYETAGGGRDCMQLRYKNTAAGAASVYVSNVSISGVRYHTLAEELLPGVVLPDVKLDAVAEDIVFPAVYESPYMGALDLHWSSSNPAVLDPETGKVTRPDSRVNAYVYLTLTVNNREIWTEEVSVLAGQEPMLDSPVTLGAAFAADAVILDGSTDENGWNLNTKVGSTGKFGVQWDLENLYFAAVSGNKTVSLVLNGQTVDLSNAVCTDGVLETAVALSSIHVAAKDYGEEITAKVTIGQDTWEGTIVLTSTYWFATDSTHPRIPAPVRGNIALGADMPTANQGSEMTDDGWHYFDYYSSNGENPANIRTYVIFWGTGLSEEQQAIFQPLANRSIATYSEFDFYAAAMPVYAVGSATGWNSNFASYGFHWIVSGDDGDNKISTGVSMGILNTHDGLVFVAQGQNGISQGQRTETVLKLNKQLGEKFRIGTRWEVNGDLTVFVDGVKIGVIDDVEVERSSYGDKSLITNLIRSKDAAQSHSDDFDIYISNIALGKAYGDRLVDNITISSILGSNTDAYSITENLVLPAEIATPQFSQGTAVTWGISHPEIIAPDGTITRPEKGQLVTLTATASGKSKTFTVYVQGTKPNTDVMVVAHDQDAANGAAYPVDVYQFTLDTDNNSIVRDLGKTETVNVICLNDSDGVTRLNESVLTIWVSDDNAHYTQVESFKLLRAGNQTYLYDFVAEGRYIKVHCTHYLGSEADFIAPLPTMLEAYYQEVFGADSTPTSEKHYTVTNNDAATVYDSAWVIAGAAAEDARVYLGDELLYHTVSGNDLIVRIPEIAGNSQVTVTVLSGFESAMDIANAEGVYEVVYGTREATLSSGKNRWMCELPDGSILALCYGNAAGLTYSYSYDCGRTWTGDTRIPCTTNWLRNVGGVVYDPHNGRIIVEGYQNGGYIAGDHNSSDCKTRFIYSDDGGRTWNRCDEMVVLGEAATYALSYSDPVIVSSYDGEAGGNVDMVLNMAVQSRKDDGSFVCRVAYSCDAGLTWTLGADEISFSQGEGILSYEGGVSEGTILENEDGVLVLLARCQYDSVNTLARSVSYDFGKTWKTAAELSDVYSVNTQPVFHQFGGSKLLFWPGNNVMGGNSYHRMPLNVAVSYDGLETFENIQDLYSRISLQGMTRPSGNQSTNPSVANIGDTLLVNWDNNFANTLLLRVDNFTDFFYRTKGAYDTFENSTIKYEGWSLIIGNAQTSDEQAYDGSSAMKIMDASSVVRSVPYLQNGTVSFMLYLEDMQGTLQLELESAYSDEFGEAAPIALEISGGKLCGLALQPGWNEITFNLALTEGTASLTVNGETAALSPDLEIGDYICYAEIGYGTTVCYVDNFLVVDQDPQTVPDAPESPADRVEALIDAIGEVTLDSAEAIAEARAAYDALTDAQKAQVSNYDVLLAAEAALESLQKVQIGDCNGDGIVNPMDALLLLQYYIGIVSEEALTIAACDCNGDGTRNPLDALLILQYYIGIIETFPVEN